MRQNQTRLESVIARIREAEDLFARPTGSVALLAVSKTHAPMDILDVYSAGQVQFGESYVHEAVEKIRELRRYGIEWHFIGRIQSNKTKAIAENFAWVHSVDSVKHALRLSKQRPSSLDPLNICLQINISGESSKGGIMPEQVPTVISAIRELPRIVLRGFMTLPAPNTILEQQREPFARLRRLRDRLVSPELPLATLSMGMSNDLEAAIAEGATIVRVGTAIFGPRLSTIR